MGWEMKDLENNRQWSFYQPGLIFGSLCLIYVFIAILSYSDIIFTTELASSNSLSAIETGSVTSPLSRQAIWLILCCLLLELYRAGFELVRKQRVGPRYVFWLVGVISLIAFATAPFDSTDVSVYINQGWLQTHYHVNPYNTCVSEIPQWMHDPMLKQHWTNSPCLYGPLFAAITAAITMVGQNNYLLNVFLFKTLNLACHIGIALLLFSSVKAMSSKEKSIEAVFLYGVSPFILLQQVANVHNDLILTFFSCLALFFVIKRKYLFVVLACIAGAAIKYISILLLPGFALLLWRSASRKVFLASLLIGFIPAIAISSFYFPTIDAHHLELILTYVMVPVGNLRSLLEYLRITQLDQDFSILANLAYLIFFVVTFIGWLKTKQESLLSTMIHDFVLLLALYLCAVTAHLYPWYIAMFVPLGLLITEDCKVRRFSIIVSCTMLFSLLWFGFPNPFYGPLFIWGAFMLSRFALITPAPVPEPCHRPQE
jgi:hypothetical protein